MVIDAELLEYLKKNMPTYLFKKVKNKIKEIEGRKGGTEYEIKEVVNQQLLEALIEQTKTDVETLQLLCDANYDANPTIKKNVELIESITGKKWSEIIGG